MSGYDSLYHYSSGYDLLGQIMTCYVRLGKDISG